MEHGGVEKEKMKGGVLWEHGRKCECVKRLGFYGRRHRRAEAMCEYRSDPVRSRSLYIFRICRSTRRESVLQGALP